VSVLSNQVTVQLKFAYKRLIVLTQITAQFVKLGGLRHKTTTVHNFVKTAPLHLVGDMLIASATYVRLCKITYKKKGITMNDSSSIPKFENIRLEHEARRWGYVKDVARRDGMPLSKAAQFYNIDIKVVGANEFDEVVISEKKEKRSAKYASIDKYIKENVGSEITTQEVADISGFSYPTAVKYITDHPNSFRKLARGKFEIRDGEADKKEELSRGKEID